MTGMISITAIVRLAFGPATKEKQIAVIGAFFDDSGTHAGAPLIVIGGVIGTGEQWDDFASRWEALLRSPLPGKPPLRQFHLAPCRAGEGEFQGYNRAERDRITFLFRRLIVDQGFVTVASAVDRAAWDEIMIGDLSAEAGDPIGYCFVKCVDLVVGAARARRPGEEIMFFFDEATKPSFATWSDHYLSQKKRYPEIASFTFAPVGRVAALQAADMIASETYQFGREWLRDSRNPTVNPHFREFMQRDLSAGIILDRDSITSLASNIRNAINERQ